MMWVAAAAEVSGPLLISYFIDNMVAKNNLPLKMVAGLAAAYLGYNCLPPGYITRSRCCLIGRSRRSATVAYRRDGCRIAPAIKRV
ncbi:multidrug ABC transporter ATP-binding protein [Escherichia coli]|uniref:Multidrug ABC transporter ATP-binding protein n=1 Tax=Escherichia coli TaxID=562 RepID=A0A376U3M2_ECOLX|nr:multidrug ABC transporter ATP-binding protein [Escherichia coli]